MGNSTSYQKLLENVFVVNGIVCVYEFEIHTNTMVVFLTKNLDCVCYQHHSDVSDSVYWSCELKNIGNIDEELLLKCNNTISIKGISIREENSIQITKTHEIPKKNVISNKITDQIKSLSNLENSGVKKYISVLNFLIKTKENKQPDIVIDNTLDSEIHNLDQNLDKN